MDRLISEKQIIDTIKTWATPLQISNTESIQDLWVEDVCRLIKAIPSAEPCEDAISRQAVLEQTYNWSKDEFLRVANPFDYLRKRINSLPPVKPQEPKWIPVSERLPNHDEFIKNNGLFNVSDGNRSYSEWFDIYDKQRFREPTISNFHVDYAVIAWMPLPESYKAERE